MSDHYYTQKPGVKHDRRMHEAVLRGQKYRFATDAGVFSKAGVDYGSQVLIESITLNASAAVLDVGCGYGPIGIAAASLVPQGSVTMIDINERAVELAKENAALNGVRNATVIHSDLFEAVKDRKFDVILTNPPIRAGKSTVHQIFEEGWSLLNPGGEMWVVIQKKQGAPSALAKLETLFERIEEVTKDKGYRIYRAVKQ
ncbi:class I SAM-dependent methyltransferase [Paenibacillus sp. GCM10012307]|uniref:Class I SAM-dependent methyltransferase n=1 Tax=Paenibacillus roseus TaxID=2798579 RepID=A0A934IXC8_9BACL|nr:class I SAM-dependent methyltransferase [Paenibacillus roseus]MBJ6361022.1 class I SAM-dependent methyltransferase [Paenibacillus roseus]